MYESNILELLLVRFRWITSTTKAGPSIVAGAAIAAAAAGCESTVPLRYYSTRTSL